MATGGIFTLITNDGKQDRMLMATHLLNRRLRDIRCARAADPTVADPTPTLMDASFNSPNRKKIIVLKAMNVNT